MENTCNLPTRPRNAKEFFTSRYFWKPFIATVVGALGGFLYYYFVGCNSGTCAISSNPYMSILWGAALGFFLVNSPCASGRC